jgi:cell division septation protein DedD
MVGRRVEARGHVEHARTKAATDPLAALDGLEAKPNLSFQGSLTGAQLPNEVERKIGELEKTRAAKPDVKPEPVKGEAKKPEPIVAKKPESVVAKKPEPANVDDKPIVRPEQVKKPEVANNDKPVVKPEAAKKPEKAEDKPVVKPDQAKPTKKPSNAEPDVITQDDKPAEDKKPKPKFTLQLSSFQDKVEADAFLSSVKAAGYQAYLTEAEVSGKGTFYRVRLGSYRSLDAANDAKADVEKTLRKSASVMRL